MVAGFVPDKGDKNWLYPFRWFRGVATMCAEKRVFGFTWIPRTIAVRERGMPVAAFRCDGCGYLEWYARHDLESS